MNSLLLDPSASMLDRIRSSMVGLKMPRAIEVVDDCVSRLDRGEIPALEAVEQLLLEELTSREERRIRTALWMGRVNTVKTLAGYDFSFQPSLDKARIMALAKLNFVARAEVVHLLGPPGTGKSHLASVLGLEVAKAGKSLSFITLALPDRRSGESRTRRHLARTAPFLLPAIRQVIVTQISQPRPPTCPHCRRRWRRTKRRNLLK